MHIHHYNHHLGDVEDDGEEEGGQDVDGQVDRGGVAPLQIAEFNLLICSFDGCKADHN